MPSWSSDPHEVTWNVKTEEKKIKLLGVWLNSKYKFLDHVNYLVKVCSFKMASIRKIAHWLMDKNLLAVVSSLNLSHITYCFEIYLWLPKVRKKFQRILNSAMRLVLRRDRYTNCAVMSWNEFQLSEQVFPDEEMFKEWSKKKIICQKSPW